MAEFGREDCRPDVGRPDVGRADLGRAVVGRGPLGVVALTADLGRLGLVSESLHFECIKWRNYSMK